MIKLLLRLFITLLLMHSSVGFAFQVPHPMQKGINLETTGAISYFRDASGSLTLQDIIAKDKAGSFKPLPQYWNAGYTADTIWMKFTLDFPATDNKYWLEISPATLDDIVLYSPQQSHGYSRIQMGDHYPASERPILHHNFIFPLSPDPAHSAQTYYVRLKSTNTITFQATLWQPHIFVSDHSRPDNLVGAYYGVRLFLALFAFILWLWLRHNSIFILYALYQCIVCSAQAFIGGMAQITLPIAPLTIDALQKSTNFLLMATVLFFYASLFQLKQFLPGIFRLIQGLTILELVIFAGIATQILPFSGLMANILALLNIAILIYCSIWLIYHKHFDFLLYVLALWAGFGAYVFIILQNFGIDIGPPTTMVNLPIAWSLLSLILVTLGIINIAKKETEKKLQAKELALELSQESKRILDQRVHERTQQLALINSKLNEEITERQALQTMLEDSLQKKRELIQAQHDFFAMASHEFRTPLAIIDTTSQRLALLQSQPGLDTSNILAPALRKIRRSSQRMSRIIDNFLSTDKIEAIQANDGFSQKILNLAQLAKISVEHYQDFSDRHITLELISDPANVLVDQYLINLVISNLIDNALKYSPSDSNVIVRVFQGQHYCHLEVQDFGEGIAPELQNKIFEKYVRINDNTTVHGTGLGLHVARSIAENHRGQLIVRSTVGDGSCFRLTLPRYNDEITSKKNGAQ